MNYVNVKTAIIGSGVAGIACALNLLKHDYTDFCMFEALDRIGGRVHSIDYDKSFLEMGAQFIHGQQDNPIYYVARDHKQIEDKYLDILDDDEDENLVDYSGIPVSFSENLFLSENGEKLDENFVHEIYNITSKAIQMNTKFPSLLDKSLADSMLSYFNCLINEKYSNASDELKSIIYSIFMWRCKCENIENGCTSLTRLSANSFPFWQELKGSQIIELDQGFTNIINLLLKDYHDEFYSKLSLRHSLRQLLICNKQSDCFHCQHTSDSNKIVLLLENLEQNGQLVVLCDHVVLTPSLGYLKENLTRMIQPMSIVPKEKLLAIERVGYGTVNKIFLFYDEPFWGSNVTSIHPIWLLKSNETILEKLDKVDESNWYENISYFDLVKSQKNVLCAWLSGSEFFENFSSEKIAQDCTKLLRKFFANENIPEPKKILKSTWNSNKYFKGSYSHLPVNSRPSDFIDIQAPIKINQTPVVLFAGEATIKEYYSTVHGAYMSGIRESERLLNISIKQI